MQQKAKKPTVLLVESNISVRHALADYLRECGFKVLEALSGMEARTILAAGNIPVDVTLADAQTPGAGFSLASWVRATCPQVEMVLSGSIEASVNHAARLCQNGPALHKPYEHHLVLDRIRQALARRPTPHSGGDKP